MQAAATLFDVMALHLEIPLGTEFAFAAGRLMIGVCIAVLMKMEQFPVPVQVSAQCMFCIGIQCSRYYGQIKRDTAGEKSVA